MVNKRLGDVVKQERLKLNLSQNALAEQAKVSLRTVSDIETYNGNPRLDSKRLNFRHGYKNPRPHFCNRSTLIIHI